MFRVAVLRKAQRMLDSLRDTLDGGEIQERIDLLEWRPYPDFAQAVEGESSARKFYVGENRKWMVVYEIDEEISTVYVHTIERRPSAGLDPR